MNKEDTTEAKIKKTLNDYLHTVSEKTKELLTQELVKMWREK